MNFIATDDTCWTLINSYHPYTYCLFIVWGYKMFFKLRSLRPARMAVIILTKTRKKVTKMLFRLFHSSSSKFSALFDPSSVWPNNGLKSCLISPKIGRAHSIGIFHLSDIDKFNFISPLQTVRSMVRGLAIQNTQAN